MNISEVSKRSGVHVETIRFYEREGVVKEPPRKKSGYRVYDETVFEQLSFLKRCQSYGFSLSDIRDLIASKHDPEIEWRMAQDQINVINKKIHELMVARGHLEKVARGEVRL